VAKRNVQWFRVSISGFSQETYGKTHVGGNAETVKNNMSNLAYMLRRHNAKTKVQVSYHRYAGREVDEAKLKAYSESLGFEFEPVAAMMFPLEKAIEFVSPGQGGGALTAGDRETVKMLGYRLEDVLVPGYENEPCFPQHKHLTLDHRGEVQLCCHSYIHSVGKFLDIPLTEARERILKHDFCGTCLSHGGHVYNNEQFNDGRPNGTY
jgi:hypothetical protein